MEIQWELMIFTLFVCLGAGIFALQGLLVVLGKGEKIQLPAMIAALASIVVGGVGSFLHLQHWERIFSGFGHITSGITQELIGIVVFVLALAIYFILWRRSKEGILPKWCGVMALVVSVALVFVMANSYNMSARPVWDTPLLWLYYLSNAFLLGTLGVALISGIRSDGSTGLMIKLALIAGIVHALAVASYAFFFTTVSGAVADVGYHFDPSHPTAQLTDTASVFSSVFTGDNALLFWLGVVVVGLLVPIALTLLTRKQEAKKTIPFIGIALICVLVAGMCFRAILYILGFSVFMLY